MNSEIHVGLLTPCPTAIVRRRAAGHELSRVVPEACGIVWSALRAAKVSGAGRHVAVYLDDKINLEVGVEIEAPFGGSGEVVDSVTPGGLAAWTIHYGPYQLLHQAHDAIQAWCAQNGHTRQGVRWELYGHWKEEWSDDPSQITTEVYYLLA